MSHIPVTVLTGYLGAGKTTLLNRILTGEHGKKYAVIVNEFGEIGIDNDLVVDTDEEIFEMNNGCICCTVRGDLVRILEGLMKRKGRFDAILLETTGLAEPAPVAQTFFMDDDVRARTKLDAVVTVVDAKHLPARLADSPEPKNQIAFADIIIVNKVDLVSAEELADVEGRIRALNPYAKLIRSVRAEVPLDEILGRGAFDLDRILSIEPDFLESNDHDHHHHDHDHGHHHHHHHKHYHDEEMGSVSLSADRPLDPNKFMPWIQRVTQEQGPDILRLKGILDFKNDPQRFVVQGIHMILEGDSQKPWKPDEARSSRLIFIGKNLDADKLRKGFEATIAG